MTMTKPPDPPCGVCGDPVIGYRASTNGGDSDMPCCSFACASVAATSEPNEVHELQVMVNGALNPFARAFVASLARERHGARRERDELAARLRTAVGLLTDVERNLDAIRALLNEENAR